MCLARTDGLRMQKPTNKQTRGVPPAMETIKLAVANAESAKLSSIDYEALGRNLARIIEEGGKALAAYMKPREEGKIKGEFADEVADVVKTIGQVAEYWLADPQRSVELQNSLRRSHLDLWASPVKRIFGGSAPPGHRADR